MYLQLRACDSLQLEAQNRTSYMWSDYKEHLACTPIGALLSPAAFNQYAAQFHEDCVASALVGTTLDGQRDIQQEIAASVQCELPLLDGAALALLTEESLKTKVNQFAANVSALAKPFALQGKSCFAKAKELQDIDGFEEFIAPSALITPDDERWSGLCYKENQLELPVWDEFEDGYRAHAVEHDMSTAAQQNNPYLMLLKSALEKKSFCVDFKLINDMDKHREIEWGHFEGMRELPVGINLSW